MHNHTCCYSVALWTAEGDVFNWIIFSASSNRWTWKFFAVNATILLNMMSSILKDQIYI